MLCRFVELELVSNTSKKLLRKFGMLGMLGMLGMPDESSVLLKMQNIDTGSKPGKPRSLNKAVKI